MSYVEVFLVMVLFAMIFAMLLFIGLFCAQWLAFKKEPKTGFHDTFPEDRRDEALTWPDIDRRFAGKPWLPKGE